MGTITEPTTALAKLGKRRPTRAAYGSVPEIWFTDADGELDAEALRRYLTTGTLWAKWDCGPIEGTDGDELVL
ncbi:hypothetical protein ACWEMJ_33920, partial [Kitasatospora sp. NPDC004531]